MIKDLWWNDYVGIKFVNGGRDRNGCDCAGLVCLVYRELLQLDVSQHFGFYDATDRQQAADLLLRASREWNEVQTPADFDVALLRELGTPCHVGIVCNKGRSILHVQAGINAVIQDLSAWTGHIDSFWRQP